MNGLDGIGEGWLLGSYGNPASLPLSLPEQLANKIADGIIKGTYAPGQRLLEADIALMFSVSRGPVREALRILEREGLVVIRARHGSAVSIMTPQRLREIFEVCALLLGLAARKVAKSPTKDIVAFFEMANKALKNALGDAEHFMALGYRVSIYVAEKAESELARSILTSLGRQTLSVTRLAYASRDDRMIWFKDWCAAAAAIERRNPVKAEELMRRLIETAGKTAMRLLHDQKLAGPRLMRTR
jgi:DNA-binding GntR family transcriptional regulator